MYLNLITKLLCITVQYKMYAFVYAPAKKQPLSKNCFSYKINFECFNTY